MSDKNARTISNPSNRAKPKESKEKKVVFKGVLDSPFRIQWPSVPLNLQNSIMAYMLELLEGASDYHYKRCASSRKRKRAVNSADTSQRNKARKLDKNGSRSPNDMDLSEPSPTVSNQAAGPSLTPNVPSNQNRGSSDAVAEDVGDEPPLLMRHLLYGINAVTKRLEIQAHNARRPAIITVPEPPTAPPKLLKYIFVCRADVDPALLINHLPHLVAAYNSTHPSEHVKLVPLPQGSELALAQVLGIRRVTVLAIDIDYPDDPRLKSMLEPVPILTASWLSQSKSSPSLVPTHIKHLRTTAPKDMKEAKESRVQGRAVAKQKKLAQKSVAASNKS
ncbi:hypothetical protein BDZ97DRAFT_1647723 [Flammula alnicola]|nr:hypothetical protein BDZ97DRAFT_1647723 [Flammula alnicola]